MSDSRQWKTIKGWPDYEVSDQGEVRRRDTKKIMRHQANAPTTARWLRLRKDGQAVNVRVDKLVAEAFVPKNRIRNAVVEAADGNKGNLSASNLRWVPAPKRAATSRRTQKAG